MLETLGCLQNRVEIHQILFDPIGITLPDRCRSIRSGVDLTAERSIQFRRAITGDKLRFFETEYPRPYVGAMPWRRRGRGHEHAVTVIDFFASLAMAVACLLPIMKPIR